MWLQNLFYLLSRILKFLPVDFDETCDYLQEKNGCNKDATENISDLRVYCNKTVPFSLL